MNWIDLVCEVISQMYSDNDPPVEIYMSERMYRSICSEVESFMYMGRDLKGNGAPNMIRGIPIVQVRGGTQLAFIGKGEQ